MAAGDRGRARRTTRPQRSRAGDGSGVTVRARAAAAGIGDIADKLEAGTRLSFDDGVRLFDCPDLLALGSLANREREKRHGGRTYYNFNIRLEATNRSEEHTSELQSRLHLVCRLLLEKKKKKKI